MNGYGTDFSVSRVSDSCCAFGAVVWLKKVLMVNFAKLKDASNHDGLNGMEVGRRTFQI